MSTRYEADLLPQEPRKVYGARGVESKPFTRTFKNAAAMNRWLETDGADCEIYSIERASMTTLFTNNEAWGFWGTIAHNADPAQAWPIAMQAVSDATGCSETAVRDFLDSRNGQHFADDVTNGLFDGLSLSTAIDAAVERWMDWPIGRHIERETGIPRGLPYLTGWVTHFEILAEAAA